MRAARESPPAGQARDAFVLLSGGGTPLTNNYSQYLQARAMADYFRRECPRDATWVFFGAGNREGDAPVLGDVRRETVRDGLLVQSWLPGSLNEARPATRDSFLRALREEILPRVREGGTLYLFVGDHGEIAGTGDKRESVITMWQLKQSRRRGWFTDDKEVLGVGELRQVLAEGLGEGRVVFCMTQCHSGGFHELGINREMVAPRTWFASPPAGVPAIATGLRLRIAGFTATDEDSPAAGCDADPDPERWAGYERYLPEALFGLDAMTGRPKGSPATTFTGAHVAATLVDQTIDKPRGTSDHYLEAWARTIESKLSNTLAVTARTLEAAAAYRRAVDTGKVTAADAELRARGELFATFRQRMTQQVPAARGLLTTGTRSELETAINAREPRGGGRGPRRGAMAELRRVWSDTLRPAWKSAVDGGRVPVLSGAALDFERQLLKIEDGGRDLLLPRGGGESALQNELYWSSGYSEPAKLDRARAEAMARWAAERRSRIVAWGRGSGDAAVREAAEKIGPGPVLTLEPVRPLSRKTAAERELYHRRVLAAWEFLLTMDARDALAELHTLIALEQTPVPRRTGGLPL